MTSFLLTLGITNLYLYNGMPYLQHLSQKPLVSFLLRSFKIQLRRFVNIIPSLFHLQNPANVRVCGRRFALSI